MTRMSELYTKNPNLGDAAPLVHRLAENQKNLDGLQAELAKFQVISCLGRRWEGGCIEVCGVDGSMSNKAVYKAARAEILCRDSFDKNLNFVTNQWTDGPTS